MVALSEGNHEIKLTYKLTKCYTNGRVGVLSGKVALFYGPTLLCAEGQDNECKPYNLIPSDELVRVEQEGDFTFFTVKGKVRVVSDELYLSQRAQLKDAEIKLIPYRTWANRGKDDMLVWFDDVE